MLTRFGAAWLAMGIAFGLHVADEAAHDFLAWYNPIARRIRSRLEPLPFPPTFTFGPWLLGLLAVTAAELGLTPVASGKPAWIRGIAVAFGVINVANALIHLIAAAKLRRRVPGVLSAPLLLVAAVWLLLTVGNRE
jgi:hypothetical protein